MSKEIVARFVIASLAVFNVGLAEFETSSLNYQMAQLSGFLGRSSIIVLGALCLLAWFDLALEAMSTAPESKLDRFKNWLVDIRQGKWMTVGCLFFLYAFVLIASNLSVILSLMFMVQGTGAFMIAFADMFQEREERYKSEERLKRAHSQFSFGSNDREPVSGIRHG